MKKEKNYNVLYESDKKFEDLIEYLDVENDKLAEVIEEEDEEEDLPALDEDIDEDADEPEKLMSEEDLKIESLKIATNIAKLMSDVTTEDILEISKKVADFIRNHEIGQIDSVSNSNDESSDDTDDTVDFDLENDDERSTENAESEETAADAENMLDFDLEDEEPTETSNETKEDENGDDLSDSDDSADDEKKEKSEE